jgi:hypothetical protein
LKFDTDILPIPPGDEPTLDGAPERCHYIVVGIADDVLWKAFENSKVSDLTICDNGAKRPITLADITAISKLIKQLNALLEAYNKLIAVLVDDLT